MHWIGQEIGVWISAISKSKVSAEPGELNGSAVANYNRRSENILNDSNAQLLFDQFDAL